jgi:lipopolysaccharide export system protein LptA
LHFFKYILMLTLTQLLFTTSVFAEKVEITSNSMKAENLKKEVHFIGNAKVKKSEDWIHANKIIVYFDDNNDTKMYKAIGKVTFEFKNEKGHYKGKSEKVTYYPQTSFYVLNGKAKVDDVMNKRQVKGDQITLDMLTGDSQVKGSKKKPVKFIFTTEESK